MSGDINCLSKDEIRQRLIRAGEVTYDIPQAVNCSDMRKAAVLAPLVRFDNSWHLLFIRRTVFEADMHSGQVAFPGGKQETVDQSLEHTALRETQEELGIAPDDVHLLGELGQHLTISNFRVTPFVGTLNWPYALKPDQQEVAHTFTLPLDWLANRDNYQVKHRNLDNFDQPVPVIYFKEYDGELLWGATARMVVSLVSALFD